MNKFDLIQQLEGKLVPTRNGTYAKVKNGKLQLDFDEYPLLNYEVGELEIMYAYHKNIGQGSGNECEQVAITPEAA